MHCRRLSNFVDVLFRKPCVASMTPHAYSRVKERAPHVNADMMQKAVNRFLRDGFHDRVELVRKAGRGASIYRYKAKYGANVYPVAMPCGKIVTVFDQYIMSKQKKARKFKKNVLRSRSHYKGKLNGRKPSPAPPDFDESR